MGRNRKHTILIACLALLLGAVTAEAEVDSTLRPLNPQSMGQGGCPVASAEGFDALLFNPASFASPDGSFTYYASSFWLHADPLGALLAVLDSGSSSFDNFVDEQIPSGGFGFGSADGIGYVGRGIAAAVLMNIDAYLWGPLGSAAGDLIFTLSFISGFAYPFQLKDATLTLGFDIRPMIRIQAPINEAVMQDFLDSLSSSANPLATLNGQPALHGLAVAVDFGMIVDWGTVRWGLSVRDFLGTRFQYKQDPFGDVLVSLRDSGGFPTGGTAVDNYVVPMDISTGFAYNFLRGRSKTVSDFVVHWAVCDVITTAMEQKAPTAMLHAGAQLELFNRLALRAGFNQGYLTFGLGVKLWVLDLNMAYFTREMGTLTASRASPGFTLEAAIRR